MRNSKGITLITLVITIIVLLILASVATYSGINVINSARLTTFTTELKIMQTQVNAIYQENSEKEIGVELTEERIKKQANIVFTESESGITEQYGYRYWSNELIKELGIEGVEQDFFVNLKKRSIISYEGFYYDDRTYYTLNQLPNGLYNVEYEEPSAEKPIFEIKSESIGVNKWRIIISNIEYDGYINKWKVRYRLEDKDDWKTTEDLSFVVTEKGVYDIMIENEEIKSENQKLYL